MKFKIHSKERLFNRFFKVDEVDLSYERFDNKGEFRAVRFNLERPDAVALLLKNESNNSMVMVEQFRYATVHRDDNSGWATEVIAGLIDPGESPETCAVREAFEETGYEVSDLQHLHTFYATIGISDEKVHLYFATVSDENKKGNGGGLDHENEDIAIREIPIPELRSKLDSGEIFDGKSIMALQWYFLNHKD